jgi:hypothetical protein
VDRNGDPTNGGARKKKRKKKKKKKREKKGRREIAEIKAGYLRRSYKQYPDPAITSRGCKLS